MTAMRGRRAAPLLLCAALAGCSEEDPCPPGGAGVCLALRLTGDTGAVDQLQLSLSTGGWAFDARPAVPEGRSPPLLVPLLLAHPPSETVDLVVTALRGARPVGFGRTQLLLPREGRPRVELALDPAHGCVDGARGGSESDVDCGGGCDRCDNARACNDDDDCASGLCEGRQCVTLVPQISAVDPPHGKLSGGTLVKVSGRGFPKRTPLLLRFNGTPGTALLRVSSTELQVRSPPSAQVTRVGVNLVINNRVVAALSEAFQYRHLLLRPPQLLSEAPGLGDPSPLALASTTGLIALLRKGVLTTYPVDPQGNLGAAKAEALAALDPKVPGQAVLFLRSNDLTRPMLGVLQSNGTVGFFARDGLGAAWYQRSAHLVAGEKPTALSVLDVDGDGRQDVLVSGSRGLYYLRALNDISDFENRRVFEVQSPASTDATAIAAAARGPNSAEVYLGLLDSSKRATLLHTPPAFTTPGSPMLAVGSSAELRAPVTNLLLQRVLDHGVLFGGTASGVLVVPLATSGALGTPALVGPSRGVSSLSAGDLDGDGYPELAVVQDDALALLPGDAELGYKRAQPEGAAARPVQAQFADLDGDGRPELLVATQELLRQLLVYRAE